MTTESKKERMLNDVNEHLDRFGRWNNGFADEFETVMHLMKEKVLFLSQRVKDNDDKYDFMPGSNFREIKTKYETIWTNIIDDLAIIYHRVSEVYDDLDELKNVSDGYRWGLQRKKERENGN